MPGLMELCRAVVMGKSWLRNWHRAWFREAGCCGLASCVLGQWVALHAASGMCATPLQEAVLCL